MKLIFTILIVIAYTTYSQNVEWEEMAFPEGGYCFGILCSPDNNLYTYGYNGLFKSTDSGEQWVRIFNSGVQHMVINSNNELFVGTTPLFDHYQSTFLLKSTNAGLTWDSVHSVWDWISPLEPRAGADDISYLNIDKNDNLTVTSYSNKKSYKRYQALRSTDNGKSWLILDTNQVYYYYYNENYFIKHITDMSFKNSIYEICINNKKHIGRIDTNETKAIKNIQYLDSNNVYALFQHSLYYSSDSGKNWNDISLDEDLNYHNLLIHGTDLILKTSYKTDYYLYKSTDNGKTWKNIETNCFDDTLHVSIYSLGIFHNLIVDSTNNIYLTDYLGIKKSSDSCKTFERKNKGYYNKTSLFGLASDNKGNMYYGADYIYRSIDNGNSWEKVYNAKGGIWSIVCLNNGDILAVDSDLKIIYSQDNGKTWDARSYVNVHIQFLKPDKNDNIFSWGGSLLMGISRDKGYTWGPLPIETRSFITFNSKNDYFSADEEILYHSSDEGYTWDEILNAQDYINEDVYKWGGFSNCQINKKNGIGFIHSNVSVIFKTTDDGYTWENIPDYLTDGDGKKYKNPNYPENMQLYTSAIDSADNFWLGLNYTTDNGESWINTNKNIPDYERAREMLVNSNGYIFWEGAFKIYRSKQPIVSVREKNEENDYFSISPNPASDYIEITINKPSEGLEPSEGSEIAIYDVLGNKVAHSSTSVPSGHLRQRRTQKIDISHLPRGVYFVRIGNDVQKFVKD